MNRFGRTARAALGVAAVAIGAARCNSPTAYQGTCDTELQLVAGNGQIGQVQLALDSVLKVRAMLTAGTGQCNTRPDVGATIEWSITTGGGRVTQITTVSDASGETSVGWILGAALGAQTAEAVIRNIHGTVLARVLFTATAYSAPYRALRVKSGNNQTAAPGAVLPLLPEVVLFTVREAGASLPRIETPVVLGQIVFTVMAGGGSTHVGGTTTHPDGTAAVTWTLGTAPGPQRLRATVYSVVASDPRDTVQVDFVANAASFALRIAGGNAQRDTLGARLAPVTVEYVELLDATGATRVIAGVPVTWTVLTGGGAVQAVSPTTDNGGRASAQWTLGRTLGRQSLRAAVPAVANHPAASFQVDFEAEALFVLDSVAVTPSQATITAIGGTRQLTATGYFNGQPVPGLIFDWTSLNNVIATVTSGGGIVTAHSTGGPIGIVATDRASRKADTAFVTVVLPPPPRLAYARFDAASIAARSADPAFAFNSGTGAITIYRYSTGYYEITFPNLETPPSHATVVLVTSFGQGTNWCKTTYWRNGNNRSLVAFVRCFDRTAPADAEFTIMVLSDQLLPHRFGFTYGDRPTATAAYIPADSVSYSSANQPISIARTGVGLYNANFPGLNRPTNGSPETVLVAAFGDDPYRCGLATDASPLLGATAQVGCVHAGGVVRTGIDTPFQVAIVDKGRPSMRWASAYNGAFEDATGTIILTQAQSSAGGVITQIKRGTGRYDVVFPGLAGALGSIEGVQVASASENGDFCKLLGWDRSASGQLVVQVQCFESDDLSADDQDFTILIIQ